MMGHYYFQVRLGDHIIPDEIGTRCSRSRQRQNLLRKAQFRESAGDPLERCAKLRGI